MVLCGILRLRFASLRMTAFSVALLSECVITKAVTAGMLVPEIVAAGGGLLFAFDHATIAGKIVLTLLAVVSIFSWSIMITKLRVIRFARRQNARFLAAFHKDRQPLRLFEKNARFPGAPVFNVYRAGCEEMTFHLLGSAEVDDTFRARLEIADKISPAQMGAVNAAMERAVGETALSLESQMILLATAVSGSPFLGLLGTVWGVMDAFVGVAEAGSPNLVAMAPGVSGALITTVVALCVAIPAMFGYNFLVTSIRGIIVEMDNFAAELASEFEHKYVDHGSRESGRFAEMRRYSQRQNLSTLSEINITPLLDLAFVLLIIFMITTPLLESSMNLVIPSSGTKNPPINTSHVQTVSIDRTDTIRFNNQVMDLETLTTQLVQLKQTNPDIAIVIRPDHDLPVQKLIGVMDALQRAGITKVGIATKAETN